jgi:hypothetical protein
LEFYRVKRKVVLGAYLVSVMTVYEITAPHHQRITATFAQYAFFEKLPLVGLQRGDECLELGVNYQFRVWHGGKPTSPGDRSPRLIPFFV